MELRPDDPIFVSARALCLMEMNLFTKAGVLFVQASKMYHEVGDVIASQQCLDEINNCKTKMAQRKAMREEEEKRLNDVRKAELEDRKKRQGYRGDASPKPKDDFKRQLAEAEARVAIQKKEGVGSVKMFAAFDNRTKEEEKEEKEYENKMIERRPLKEQREASDGETASMSKEEMKRKLQEAESRVARKKMEDPNAGRAGVRMFDL
mmetsp:Transcript_19364/g.40387  ORF Transcript_19364/g.40387 Transcript_19364/m.40387 type:complete len:207 (-) Transcript_19364:29-649(-)